MKKILFLLPLVAALTGCDLPGLSKPSLEVGVICNPNTFAPRQHALAEVFQIALANKSFPQALQVQRLTTELQEVCTVADQDRMRILVTNGARIDSTGKRWQLPTVKANLANLTKELEAWGSAPLPLTTKFPIKISSLPDSVRARLIGSGDILLTESLVDFGDLGKE